MDTIHYQNRLIKIGQFTLSIDDPSFNQLGYVKNSLLVFPKNNIWIKHRGKEAFVADSSLINLYNENQEYLRFPIDKRGDNCYWIEISPEFKKQIANTYGVKCFNTSNINCDVKTYLLQLQLINQTVKQPHSNSLLIDELALDIINNIYTAISGVAGKQKYSQIHEKLAQKIKKILHENLSKNKSLNEIASEVYSSPFHVSRVFKQVTGIGINSFRTQIRVKSVLKSIQKGNSDLAMLAYVYGFSSHSHLTKCFKSYFGFTPSSYISNY
jgi:AraC-like DNA-binding protein